MTNPGGGVNLATAYVTLIPTTKGLQGNLSELFAPAQVEADKAGGSSGGSFLGSFKGSVLTGIAGVAAAVGIAFVDAYGDAIEKRNAQIRVGASLGLTDQEAKDLGSSAGTLYAQGYGESLADVVDTLGIVKSSLRGLSGTELESATKKAETYSKVFGVDLTKSVSSVSTLIGSGLVDNSTEAFDLITAASQKVPAGMREDVLDASDEYSQFFRTLGFSGDEAFGALVKGSEKGQFGIDKTGDAIKEFTIRSTDMSKTSKDAYATIGLDAQTMADQILAGGDTAKSAFDKIVDGVLAIQDPTAQSNTAIALFGTQMEDMNVQDVPAFLSGLKDMSGGLGDTAGAADKIVDSMGATSSATDLFWRGIKSNVSDFIVDKVIPAVTSLTQWLVEKLGPAFTAVGDWIQTKLIPFLQLAWEWFEVNLLPAVQRVGQFIGETFSNILSMISGVIDVIGGIFSGDWSRVWEGIKSIFGGIWDQIKNLLSTAWDVIWSIITNIGPKIWEWVSALAGDLLGWGADIINWLWDGIKSVANNVWDWFLGIPGFIWDRIKDLGSQIGDYGKQIISWIWDGIKDGATAVWGWFSGGIDDPNSLIGGIWNAVKNVGSFVIGIGKAFVGWIVEGIAAVASTIWDAITSVFKGDQIVGAAPGSAEDPIAAALTQYTIATGGRVGVDRGGKANGGRIQWLPNGMIDGPGGPRDDVIPTMLSNGEYVVNAAATAEWLPLLEQINWGRMAGGGLASAGAAAKSAGSHIALLYGAAVRDQLQAGAAGAEDPWLASTISNIRSKFAPVYNASAGVEQWRGTVLQALALTNQSAAYADTVLHQMATESSGNPAAINLTDINAQRGIPSKGLMQVIDPTFRSYAMPGYSSDIYDPLSNILASIRYVLDRYGSIPAGMRGVAYDQGGWMQPGGSGVNLLNEPEPVLTPAQWDIAERALAYVAAAPTRGTAGNSYQFTIQVRQLPTVEELLQLQREADYRYGR